MTYKWLPLLLLLMTPACWGQAARYDNSALGPRGPIPNASIAVCSQPAVTNTAPCSPLAITYTDTTATVQCNGTNGCNQPPFLTDALGNYHFYAKPPVTIQVYGPQVQNPFVMSDQYSGGTLFNGTTLGPRPWIDVTAYGAKCDGVTDDTTAIQNAINAVPATGGIVQFPPSATPCLSGALSYSASHVKLRGYGPEITSGLSSPPHAASRILWNGASGGTMLQITSTTSTIADFDSVEGIMFDCAGVNTAARGIQVISTYHTSLTHFGVRECSTDDVEVTTINGSGQPIDLNPPGNAVKGLLVEDASLMNYQTVNGRTGIPLLLTGTTADPAFPNTNYSTFSHIRAFHQNNFCIEILTGDSNGFFDVNCNLENSGTATAGVLLDASQMGAAVQDNYFYGLDPGVKGLVQQNGATENAVYGYIQDNNAPACVNTTTNGMLDCIGHSNWQIKSNFFTASTPYFSAGLTEQAATNTATIPFGSMLNVILDSTPTAAASYTTDTAANLCTAGLASFRPPGGLSNYGPSYDWWIRNKASGAFTITVLAGTGVTLDGGSTMTVAQGVSRHFKIMMNNCAAGVEAVKIWSVESGTF